MQPRTTGAWLVHHSNKLQQMNGLHGFDMILSAGKATSLLSALSATDQHSLAQTKVEVLAKASGINHLELSGILDLLQKQNLIDRTDAGIEVLGVTSSRVLHHGATLFSTLKPSQQELASITLAEMASDAPLRTSDGAEFISDTYQLSKAETGDLFERAELVGFVDNEVHSDGEKILFNGNLFRRGETAKIQTVLASLNASEQALIATIDDELRRSGCLALSDVEKRLGKPLFEKLNSISMYDISVVSNNIENVAYVTRPSAFSKYSANLVDDNLDLAKAFVSSLTYGMSRRDASQGRIALIDALLSKLISGQWTNAATAIGQDYVALELKGVVELRKGPRYGHEMRLKKTDVGEMARLVLQSGDGSELPLLKLPTASVTGYTGPEANRSLRRKNQAPENKKAIRDMVEVLRTGTRNVR